MVKLVFFTECEAVMPQRLPTALATKSISNQRRMMKRSKTKERSSNT
jgi:hypothetical protein